MIFAEDDEMVGALSADRANHPFGIWILPRGSPRGNDLLDPHVPHSPTEEHAIDRVPIPKKKPRLLAVGRERLNDLLSRPLSRWVGRHVEVNDPSPIVGEDHEAIQQPEVTVGTTKKSQAAVQRRWFRRKVRHVWDDGPLGLRGMYRATVESASS